MHITSRSRIRSEFLYQIVFFSQFYYSLRVIFFLREGTYQAGGIKDGDMSVTFETFQPSPQNSRDGPYEMGKIKDGDMSIKFETFEPGRSDHSGQSRQIGHSGNHGNRLGWQ